MTNLEARYKIMQYFIEKEYSAYDWNADDFLCDKNKVVLADESDEYFYSMKCFNNAVIVKAKKGVFDWSKRFISNHIGFRCFDFEQTAALCRELLKFDYSICGGQGSLPDVTVKRDMPEISYKIQIFNQNEIMNLNNYTEISKWYMGKPSEDTIMAVAAFENDKIIGISIADYETDYLCSLGVEISPEYQRKGIAVALTIKITNALLNQGIIPFATSAWSHNASRTTLYKCSYYPTWAYLESSNCERAIKILKDME